MATATTKDLHLIQLSVDNFMRVQALTVDADGKHVKISGRNGSGKTSAVTALWWALKSAAAQTEEPVAKGEEKAVVRIDLGEYIVERRATGKTTTLTVMAADGSKLTKPQQVLDGLLSTYSLDPVAFLSRRPGEQIEDVLAVAGVAPPVVKVAEVSGERIEAQVGETADQYLDRLAGANGIFYIRRREANRAVEKGENVLQQARRSLADLPVATEAVPASALLAEIDDLGKKQDERRAALAAAAEAKETQAQGAELLAELVAKRDKLEEEKRKLAAQITELTDRIAKGQHMLPTLQADAEKAAQHAAAMPDQAAKIAELKSRLATAEKSTEAAMRRKHLEEHVAQLTKQLKDDRDAMTEASEILDGLRGLRSRLLEGLDLGIPGLAIGQGELRLNDVPFSQASNSERIRVACAIAMAQNPRLKLLRLDNAESLDEESMRLVLNAAEERGWQVVATRVENVDGLKVEIVE